ncbi:MAG: CBS domain-containing protein [Bryobacteraceae bacterium]
MTVGSLMNATPVTVPLAETFAGAYRLMTSQRLSSIPVVDTRGVYQGMFDFQDVWELLLPRAALLGMESLTNLAFLSEAVNKLHDKLEQAGSRPIREFLDATAPPVHPDTPIKEVILLFHQYNVSLPVVERGTNRLVGMISPWEVLDALQ